jgi:nitroreductase
MDLYDLMMKRRSVRNFKVEPISEEVINELLDAANNAPTGGNIQPISIIVVQDPKARADLAEMVGGQPWVKNAPLSMLFCIDFHRLNRWASMCDTDFKGERAFTHFLISYADLMCAAQNVVIMAEGHGLGSVYIGTILQVIDPARDYFSIPEGVLPTMLLSIGYPKSVPKHIPKLSRDVIVHTEKYKDAADDEIKAAFEDKYGSFEDNVNKYFERIFAEATEAEKQDNPEWADPELVKKRMNELNIRNTAQFLLKFRYPSDEMIDGNKHLADSFKKAGFDFF